MNDMEKRNLDIYNAITQKLLSQCASDSDNNVVFSPLSILVLLGILADATGSETREEIAKALGCDDNAEEIIEWLTAAQKDLMKSGALISSNAVCIREDIKNKIASGYEKHLQDVKLLLREVLSLGVWCAVVNEVLFNDIHVLTACCNAQTGVVKLLIEDVLIFFI